MRPLRPPIPALNLLPYAFTSGTFSIPNRCTIQRSDNCFAELLIREGLLVGYQLPVLNGCTAPVAAAKSLFGGASQSDLESRGDDCYPDVRLDS